VTETMRRLRAACVFIVAVAAWMSTGLLADDDAPFLSDSDPDTVCAAALHYQPPPALAASRPVTSPAIRTNDSSYRPGQPLGGLYTENLYLFVGLSQSPAMRGWPADRGP